LCSSLFAGKLERIMPRPLSIPEREAFLSDVHIAIVSVDDDCGQAPYAVPVWYRYEPGGLVTIMTRRRSRKVSLIERLERFSLTVQKESPPYRYVTVEGPVVAFDVGVDPEEWNALHERYLGSKPPAQVAAATERHGDGLLTIRMQPEHWTTGDFSQASA
jgi:hypothetical protein